MGLYQRKGIWYIRYVDHRGKIQRESSGSEKKTVAKALLKKRQADDANGKLPGDVRFEKLAAVTVNRYEWNGHKSLKRLYDALKPLQAFFGNMRASRIDAAMVNEYISYRRASGVCNGTVNVELNYLRIMFNDAEKLDLLNRKPFIAKLEGAPPRSGFFEHSDFLAVRDAMPGFMKGWFTFGYLTGWRRLEISKLRWEQVDSRNGTITLNAEDSKNGEARILYMSAEARAVIDWQWQLRLRSGKIQPYVFPDIQNGGHIRKPDAAWNRAFKQAGVPRKLFHDLRRTFCRNALRSGLNERTIMKLSGHKDRRTFDKYCIVSEADLREAAKKQSEYLASLEASASKEHKKSTVVNFPQQSRAASL